MTDLINISVRANLAAHVGVHTSIKFTNLELIVDCVCAESVDSSDTESIDFIFAPEPVQVQIAPRAQSVPPLHIVFLIDTSDSFNSADTAESKAGQLIFENFVARFIQDGNV